MSFQAPIGTAAERASGVIWPGRWLDATPYLTKYFVGIHTGADLNLPGDADRDAAVYTIGDGTVTYAQMYPNPKAWGNIIVIDHGIVDGKPLFSRYGHVGNIRVSKGQAVRMGDQIATVGNGNNLFAYHLHFDISTTTVLREKAGNWPAPSTKPDPSLVKPHYVDTKKWLQEHFGAHSTMDSTVTADVISDVVAPVVVVQQPKSAVQFVIATDGIFIRDQPGLSTNRIASLLYGARVSVEANTIIKDLY